MLKICLPALIVSILLPAFASDPGQPLDCDDWTFLEPGLSCEVVGPVPCDSAFCESLRTSWSDEAGNRRAFDNDGNLYMVRRTNTAEFCVFENNPIGRLELVHFTASGETVVAYLEERCREFGGSNRRIDWVTPARWSGTSWPGSYETLAGVLTFDRMNGEFVIPLRGDCVGSGCEYGPTIWVARISGFATTFEILQTYTPTPGPISFRVPYMPEGFRSADWFDTYHGDLATVGDWSQAQPLECEYPASVPNVGDYLTIDAPLPQPAPGQGRYYVTATTHQGQRRYGRKAINGILSGRDPALLPTCFGSGVE